MGRAVAGMNISLTDFDTMACYKFMAVDLSKPSMGNPKIIGDRQNLIR